MPAVIDTLTIRPRHPEKAHRPDAPMLRKPDWIRVKAPVSRGYAETQRIVKENGLHTVCEEAGCPNIGECWEKKHATFMIMGDMCTRACAFCNVKTGLPGALDADEPKHVAEAVAGSVHPECALAENQIDPRIDAPRIGQRRKRRRDLGRTQIVEDPACLRALAGAKKAGNRNRRQQCDDGDDNHDFDESEAFVRVGRGCIHIYRESATTMPTYRPPIFARSRLTG